MLWAGFLLGCAFGVAARLGRFCLLRGLREAPALRAFAQALAWAGWADLNPAPLACRLQFTVAAGTAEAAVRVRLSQSQTVHALARMKSGKLLAASHAVTVAASGCGM